MENLTKKIIIMCAASSSGAECSIPIAPTERNIFLPPSGNGSWDYCSRKFIPNTPSYAYDGRSLSFHEGAGCSRDDVRIIASARQGEIVYDFFTAHTAHMARPTQGFGTDGIIGNEAYCVRFQCRGRITVPEFQTDQTTIPIGTSRSTCVRLLLVFDHLYQHTIHPTHALGTNGVLVGGLSKGIRHLDFYNYKASGRYTVLADQVFDLHVEPALGSVVELETDPEFIWFWPALHRSFNFDIQCDNFFMQPAAVSKYKGSFAILACSTADALHDHPVLDYTTRCFFRAHR